MNTATKSRKKNNPKFAVRTPFKKRKVKQPEIERFDMQDNPDRLANYISNYWVMCAGNFNGFTRTGDDVELLERGHLDDDQNQTIVNLLRGLFKDGDIFDNLKVTVSPIMPNGIHIKFKQNGTRLSDHIVSVKLKDK